jgi:hypothetical protein
MLQKITFDTIAHLGVNINGCCGTAAGSICDHLSGSARVGK